MELLIIFALLTWIVLSLRQVRRQPVFFVVALFLGGLFAFFCWGSRLNQIQLLTHQKQVQAQNALAGAKQRLSDMIADSGDVPESAEFPGDPFSSSGTLTYWRVRWEDIPNEQRKLFSGKDVHGYTCLLLSPGPDKQLDSTRSPLSLLEYDPTNGTFSPGDIIATH